MATRFAHRRLLFRAIFYLFWLGIAVSVIWSSMILSQLKHNPTAQPRQLVIDFGQGVVKVENVNHEPDLRGGNKPGPLTPALVGPVKHQALQDTSKPQRTQLSIKDIIKLIDPDKPFVISFCKNDWAANAIIELGKRVPLPNVKVLQDPADANIGLRSAWGHCENQDSAKLNIFIDMEAHDHGGGNPVLTTVRSESGKERPEVIYVPYAFFHFPQRKCCKPGDVVKAKAVDDATTKEIVESKLKFAAFAGRSCEGGDGDILQTKLFDKISVEYERVDALGGCRHNAEPTKDIPEIFDNDHDRNIAWFEPYKFAIVFESSSKRGYLTQKLMDAVLANTVPIYWGPPDIAELINMDAILHCEPGDDESFNACVEEIHSLDHDDKKYLEKLSQPLFKDNVLPDWMRWEPLVESILSLYIDRVLDRDQ